MADEKTVKRRLSRSILYNKKIWNPDPNGRAVEVPEAVAERDKELQKTNPARGYEEDAAQAQTVAGEAVPQTARPNRRPVPTHRQVVPGHPESGSTAIVGTDIDDDFPHARRLRDAGYTTYESLEGTNLQDVEGIGKGRAADIQKDPRYQATATEEEGGEQTGEGEQTGDGGDQGGQEGA